MIKIIFLMGYGRYKKAADAIQYHLFKDLIKILTSDRNGMRIHHIYKKKTMFDLNIYCKFSKKTLYKIRFNQ